MERKHTDPKGSQNAESKGGGAASLLLPLPQTLLPWAHSLLRGLQEVWVVPLVWLVTRVRTGWIFEGFRKASSVHSLYSPLGTAFNAACHSSVSTPPSMALC